MKTKTARMTALLHSGDHIGALRIANTFKMLGDHKRTIQQGWAALQNPGFYEQIGKSPTTMYDAAISALFKLYPETK